MGLLEVALREAAGQTDLDPVAEYLAALLAQPIGRFAHEPER